MKLLSKLGLSAAAFVLAANVAEAGPLTGTFNLQIYQTDCLGCSIASPGEQAAINNVDITPGNLIASGTYTGQLNWQQGGTGTGSLATFLTSSGGTFTGNVAGFALSSAPFDLTTIIVITGNIGGVTDAGSVLHDDGESLYDGGSGFANLVSGSPTPTSATSTPYSGLTGTIGDVYVEANGLPADFVLNVTSSVPEPLTLSLMGAMLAGAGAAGLRRRQKKSTQA